ncbi:MAG: rRNA pseudouridine synthase [Clostridiales bacterium]|nr:rRNA pseudouridine synthase [Clostridiales bacterium]
MAVERLDKALASQGTMSRSDVKKIIKNGGISVNGVTVKDNAFKVNIAEDIICLNGEEINLKKHIYIMMNKPTGVVSASEGKGEKTVVDLVPDELQRNGLFPAGRLDKDTTGFVLITDDGEFAHRILSPKNHIEKTYIATLAEPLKEGAEKLFENGLTLADGYKCLPAQIEMAEDRTVAYVTLHEGKYHQIKRMFGACNNKVVALKRISMGKIKLDEKLKLGECRELEQSELELLL